MDQHHKMKALAKNEFEAWAGTYDRSLLNRFLFQPSYRMFLRELQAWRAESTEPFDLLDIGCGTGTFDAMLAASPLPARIVGLDYAEAMCRVASDKAHAANVADRLRYVNADSQHLPFADGSFDVVTCSNSFHHYPDQQACVQQMRRVLKPGGRLILIDGFRDNVIGWVIFDVFVARIERHVHHAAWSEVRRMIADAGFAHLEQRKLNVLAPLLVNIAQR
jgi:ubiquinone/menaquinone biosynthesis C-methylase UbiE